MRQALATLAVAGVALLVATSALAFSPPSPGQVTAGTCSNFAANNPTNFKNLFGSASVCQTALTDAAQTGIAECKATDADTFRRCIDAKMSAALTSIALHTFGVGRAAKEALSTACGRAMDASPNNFKRRFGTHAKCVSILLRDATAAAQSCAAYLDYDLASRAFLSCLTANVPALVKNYNR